jgi:very-short-patch-repair endonuclease
MARKNAQPPTDRRLAELAARQHGVVQRTQLHELGLGDGAIEGRASLGRLHRVHRGVFSVGHPLLTREGRFMAAVLARGPGSVLSHLSAAVLWGILRDEGPQAHVTVPTRDGRKRRRGIVVHKAALGEEEVTRVNRIPLTRPGRTLVDLADVVPRRTLERALDEAEYLRLDCSRLGPRNGRTGSGLLARVLDEHRAGTTRTRSELEERFLALCDRYGIPRPRVNFQIDGYECDFVWHEQRLIVETDGGAAHGTRRALERDPVRDADLTVAGWRVVRVTWMRLSSEPEAVADQLEQLLKQAPRPEAPAARRPP